MANAGNASVMGGRLEDAEEVFRSLIEKTKKMGLEINEKSQNL